MLTQARLQELLTYDPQTGLFHWKVANGPRVKAGAVAGTRNHQGYRRIQLDGLIYAAHRLAFLYMEGAFPPDMVDHINGVRDDNRWCNLRHATRSENNANAKLRRDSTTGAKGVYKRRSGRFSARVRYQGQEYALGTFDTIVEASAAYERAANDAFGEYARAAAAQADV